MLDNIHQEGLQLEALELQGYMRGKGGATGTHARGGGSYRGTCGGRGELQGYMRGGGGSYRGTCGGRGEIHKQCAFLGRIYCFDHVLPSCRQSMNHQNPMFVHPYDNWTGVDTSGVESM